MQAKAAGFVKSVDDLFANLLLLESNKILDSLIGRL